MDFSQEYQSKLKTADEAVKVVQSGDWVDYGWCTGTPDALDRALARRTDELCDVKVRGGILLKPLAIFEREDAGEHFCWNSWHMGGFGEKTHCQRPAHTIARFAILNCHVIIERTFSRMTLLCLLLHQWISMVTSISDRMHPI